MTPFHLRSFSAALVYRSTKCLWIKYLVMRSHKESCLCSASSLSIDDRGRLTLRVRLDFYTKNYSSAVYLTHRLSSTSFRVGLCFDFVITNFAYICGEKNWSKFRATSEMVLIPCPNPFNDVLKMKAKSATQTTSFKMLERNTTQRYINLILPPRKDGEIDQKSLFSHIKPFCFYHSQKLCL